MNADQENIQALRRLLALKHHEQPPPGYFNRFSGEVIARIRAGERAPDSVWERFAFEATWLRQVWAAFETKPLLAGAFGATVCGLITTGFFFSDRPSNLQPAPFSVFSVNGNQSPIVQVATPVPSSIFQVPGLDASSSESVDAVPASLFRQFQEPKAPAHMVNFTLPAGN